MKFPRRFLAGGWGFIFAAPPLLVLLLLLFTLTVSAGESDYRQCDAGSTSCEIGEFLYDDDYDPVPPANAACTLSITDPSGSPLAGSPFAMNEAGDGWYSYPFNPSTQGVGNGLYRSTMCCTVTTPSQTLCLDKSFTIGPSTEDAVLDADLTDHTTAGTFGWYFQDPLGLVKDIWEYSSRSLNDFTDLVTAIWSNATRSLTTRSIGPGENIAREEEHWTTRFAGDGEILAGKTYRAKLWVLDFETELADAASVPNYTIYDSMRNVVVNSQPMTNIGTGIYELTYNVSGSATGGRWETVVDVDVDGGGTDIQDGSYWEVESSPAQVTINSITDNTVPSITANVTIKNEGGSGYEYKYVYCVVSTENNPCGNGDDTFYSSGSKFLNAGESWITNFNATVNNSGTYWFKVVVQWGTEFSGASQVFSATTVSCLGDYNSDGWVDLTDFSIMLFYWNQYNPEHDLSDDGYVNLTDFSILLYHWGRCP